MKALVRKIFLVVLSTMFFMGMSLLTAGAATQQSPAEAAFNAGDYNRAANLYAALCTRSPGNVGFHLSYAVTLLQLKQYSKAAEELEKARRLDPTSSIISRLSEAAAREQTGKPLDFRGDSGAPNAGSDGWGGRELRYAPTMKIKPSSVVPDNTNAMLKRGSTHAKIAEHTDVVPDNTNAMLKRAFSEQPGSACIANLLGDSYLLAGNQSEAEQWYRKAASLATAWNKPRVGMAITLLDSDAPQAVNLLEDVLRREPNNARAKLWLGDAYQRVGRPDDAIWKYREAEANPETKAEAGVRLGTELLRNNQVNRAAEKFEVAQQADPNNVAAATGLAQSSALQNKLPQAQQAMSQAEQVAKNSSQEMQAVVSLSSGQTLQALGELGLAIENYQRAAGQAPGLQQAYVQMARAFKSQGTLENNNNKYAQRLMTQPNDSQALRFLVEGYNEAGQPDKQLIVLRRLTLIDKPNQWIWELRQAETLWMKGQCDEACAKWKGSVNLGYPTRTLEIARSIQSREGALDYMRQMLSASAGAKITEHLLYGLATVEGNYNEAIRHLDKVIALDKANASLYGQKGILLRQVGRQTDADASFVRQRELTIPVKSKSK